MFANDYYINVKLSKIQLIYYQTIDVLLTINQSGLMLNVID